MDAIILSVIIPVYNVEKYIRKTLLSIFSSNVDYEKMEIIVIDDGTPDMSMSIVDEFSDYSCLRVFSQENKGLSSARNLGLGVARGKWVWFVDSDDWIENGFLEYIYPILEKREEDILMFKIREIEESTGKTLKIRKSLNESKIVRCSGCDVIMNVYKEKIDITPIQQYIICRSFLEKNELKFVNGLYHEDMEFAPKMLVRSSYVAYVPVVSYCYLKRVSGSITSSCELGLKRCRSLLKIFHFHHKLQKKLEGKAKRCLIKYNYSVAAYFLKNYMLFELYKSDDIYIRIYLPVLKWYVIKNIASYKSLTSLLRRVLFLLIPNTMIRHKKNIN